MEPNEIIGSLEKYKKEEFKSKFLDDTINYFKSIKTNGANGIIDEITEDEMMLAGIRLHLLYNIDNFHVYLSPIDVSKKKYIYSCRKLNLSKIQAFNLKNQIDGVEKNTFNICDNISSSQDKFYLMISKEEINELSNYTLNRDLYNVLLGIDSLYFLEHQNLKTYCDKIITGLTNNLFDGIQVYKTKVRKLTWQEQDRIFIGSGLIYQFLGTVYSSDIDLIVVGKGKEDQKLLDYLKDYDIMTGVNINDEGTYKKELYTYKLPKLVGAEDIYTMLINPKFFFHFMGLKCFNIELTIQRSVSRSHPFSFIDLYLLNTINKIKYPENTCIKNITIRQGKTSIINKKQQHIFYQTIVKYLKEWYKIDVSIDYLKEHFQKCDEKFTTIYQRAVISTDPLIKTQIGLHRQISQLYIKKYGYNANYLLDIGSGKLSGAHIYKLSKIKHVYGIEPSLYSIEQAKKETEKYPNIDFVLIHGFGDQPISINKQFDIITFIFTIHYMIKNINIVVENLINLSKPKTKIIISCINGTKVLEKLKKSNKYEITYNNDIYWGAYRYNDDINIPNPRVLFFMKDVYGVEFGSEEHIVIIDDLISLLNKNNIKLIHRKSFLEEYYQNFKNIKLHGFQKEILSLHEMLIFEVE